MKHEIMDTLNDENEIIFSDQVRETINHLNTATSMSLRQNDHFEGRRMLDYKEKPFYKMGFYKLQ